MTEGNCASSTLPTASPSSSQSKTSPSDQNMGEESSPIVSEHTFESVRDRKGILYTIGCEDNGVWKNPVSTKKVGVTASSTYRGTPSMVADHTFACQIFYTDNKPYSWVRIDFKGASVCPNYYSMAHRAGFDGYYLRDWQLQASNDGQQWVVLQEHKGDESLNKKSLVAAWPIEGIHDFYRYFQVVIAPNGNSNGTNALILSCFELYGTLKRPAIPVPIPSPVPQPAVVPGHPPANTTNLTTPHGWQTSPDGSRPLPFRVVGPGRAMVRPTPTALSHGDLGLVLPEMTSLCRGRVVSVSWQGGAIQLIDYPGSQELVPYHKSDVWVDDKKVKQLPREGDLVSFFIVLDEVTKKEKAEQVTVINHQRQHSETPNGHLSPNNKPIIPCPVRSDSNTSGTSEGDVHDVNKEVATSRSDSPQSVGESTEEDTGAMLTPEAPSSTPKPESTTTPSPDDSPTKSDADAEPTPSPNHSLGSNLEAKSSFLFEHCTGRVVFVSVPTGQIQIDGAPEDAPTIPYHYSDVWDDGKCVKQFPRVGDTVSCYIGIDPKTKKEKAENVKVICKRQQAEESPARTQIQQTIQNARYRAAANMAHAGAIRPGGLPPMGPPASQQMPMAPMITGQPLPYYPPPMSHMFPECMAPNLMPHEMSPYPPMQDPTMGLMPMQGHPGIPMPMSAQVPRCPLPYGRPQPMLHPAHVNMHPIPPQGLMPNMPQLQQPIPMLPPSAVALSQVVPGPYPGPGMAPMSTPTKPLAMQYTTAFAPVNSSPAQGGLHSGVPSTPPSYATPPVMSPILPMQYMDGASPMLFSVGAARTSPPQSPSPSPSTGMSMSSNSSLGTLNASCGESPFEPVFEDPIHKPVDVDAFACVPPEGTPEDYQQCRTPMKRNSSLSAWTADDFFGLTTPERSQKLRPSHHDVLEALLPRSPIIGDILRPSDDEPRDELLDHDLLSGDSALVALHAVSVVDF